MIGNNELLLNHATIMEAVQEWLEDRTNGDVPVVDSVTEDSGGYFVIKVHGREA